MVKTGLIVITIFFSSLFIIIQWGNQKPEKKIPGSYKALELFSYIRSYPQDDIPADAYSKAYEHHFNNIEKSSYYKNDENWEAVGPLNTGGRTLTIAVNPQDPYTIYAGSASGGLWRSRNLGLGQSWEYMTTGFPVLGVSSIAFTPGDSTTMYIGTGEVYNYSDTGTDAAYRSTRGSYGIGILKSEDGGQSWEKSLDWSYNQQHGVWMVQVSPSDHNIVYAATTDGIYKSDNAGDTWNKVFDVIMATDIDIDPDNSQKVVASFGNFGTEGFGIYYTEDGGQNWMKSVGQIPEFFNGKTLIARSNSDSNVLYASVGNGFWFNDGATWLLKSSDGGISWVEQNDFDYSKWQGWFSHDIAVNPKDETEIICVGIDIYKSSNSGETIRRMSTGGVAFGTPPISGADGPPNYSHSDHHFVIYHPELDSVVLFGNDGGIFISFDNGDSFRSANGGYQTTQFYNGFSVSRTDPKFAMGGLQDNSTVLYRGDGSWQRAIGGDGSWSAIDPSNDNIAYGSYQNLSINKSTNRGQSFEPVNLIFANGESPLFISPYVIASSNPDILYAAGLFVYKSVNKGEYWQAVNGIFPVGEDPIFSLAVAPSNHQVIYAGTVGGNERPKVFVSINGGETFEETAQVLPNRIPNDIAIDPKNPAKAYVSFSGFGSNHLYKTDNYGLSWTAIGLDLPDVSGNAVAIDPLDGDIIYYGNDIGVYASEDGGESWISLDNGLPKAIIAMDLTISPSDRKLWVATHGNGTYRINMLDGSVASNEIDTDVSIDIYPNPATDILHIKSSNLDAADLVWEIYDQLGKKLSQGSSSNINIRTLTDGQYYLKVITQNQSVTQMFLVLR